SLPTPDAAGTVNMSGSHGGVALWSAAETTIPTPIRSGDLAGATNIVDAIGYGSDARAFEGGPAPGLANSSSASRAPAGTAPDDPSTVTVDNPGTWNATVGKHFTLTMHASGGSGSYTWQASGLPVGVTISEDGVISGTPTTPGDSSVTVTATDSNDSSLSGQA